jgi:limonene 1,2-monooxygenase
MVLAGKHGLGVLSVSVVRGGAYARNMKDFWKIAEDTAEEYGNVMDRNEWRLVVHVHLAESKKEAMDQARERAGAYQREYFENTLGFQASFDGPQNQIIESMVENGAWCVGTPDDLVEQIHRLDESSGGFGGLMIQATEWGTREQVKHSYELIARYVMPQFQGSLVSLRNSQKQSADLKDELNVLKTRSLEQAAKDYEAQRVSD